MGEQNLKGKSKRNKKSSGFELQLQGTSVDNLPPHTQSGEQQGKPPFEAVLKAEQRLMFQEVTWKGRDYDLLMHLNTYFWFYKPTRYIGMNKTMCPRQERDIFKS